MVKDTEKGEIFYYKGERIKRERERIEYGRKEIGDVVLHYGKMMLLQDRNKC